jgi:hypothetical protein
MKGGRRNEQEKLYQKCQGHLDVFTNEVINNTFYALRIYENGLYFCFDARSLYEWFLTGSRINPFTNHRFTNENIRKIMYKFQKCGFQPL